MKCPVNDSQAIHHVPCGLVVRISGFHPGGRGSIPRTGAVHVLSCLCYSPSVPFTKDRTEASSNRGCYNRVTKKKMKSTVKKREEDARKRVKLSTSKARTSCHPFYNYLFPESSMAQQTERRSRTPLDPSSRPGRGRVPMELEECARL